MFFNDEIRRLWCRIRGHRDRTVVLCRLPRQEAHDKGSHAGAGVRNRKRRNMVCVHLGRGQKVDRHSEKHGRHHGRPKRVSPQSRTRDAAYVQQQAAAPGRDRHAGNGRLSDINRSSRQTRARIENCNLSHVDQRHSQTQQQQQQHTTRAAAAAAAAANTTTESNGGWRQHGEFDKHHDVLWVDEHENDDRCRECWQQDQNHYDYRDNHRLQALLGFSRR